MNKDMKIYLTLVVVVLLIIAGIYYYKIISKETPEEKTMKCISSKAILYSQVDCPHCKQQKQILGEYFDLFKIIECDKEIEICNLKKITGTPTWEINGNFYTGIKSIKELSDLAECECNANVNVIKNESIQACDINEQNQNCTKPVENICTK